MKRYTLDAKHLQLAENAYDHLKTVFHLPQYFGRNLDAFEECMNDLTHVEGHIIITCINNSPRTQSALFTSITEILKENTSVSFTS